MSKKTTRSKDAARTLATHGPATEKAKRAARKVIEQNIARIDAAERAGAAPAEQNDQPQQPQADQHQPTEAEPTAAPAAHTETPATGARAGSGAGDKRGAKAKKGGTGQPGAPSPAKGGKTPKTDKPAKEAKPKRLSCLDAAARIIGKDPVGCKDLIAEMSTQKLWTSPNGKTPEASLYAAIIREISAKGDAARFKKIDRGLFVKNG